MPPKDLPRALGDALASELIRRTGARATPARVRVLQLLRAAPGKPHAHLSRGLAGTLGEALVVNLPGSPSAVSSQTVFAPERATTKSAAA